MTNILLIHHDLHTAEKLKHIIMNCYVECSIQTIVPRNINDITNVIEGNLGTIDVCFTQIQFNGFSVFGLAKKIRTLNPKVKIVVFSDTEEYAMEAWKYGINEYLLNPITHEKIRASINNF